MSTAKHNEPTRREFVKKSAAAAGAVAGFSILSHGIGYAADPIKVGVIGCGGRGTGAIMNCLAAGDNIELVAMGDLYEEKVKDCYEYLTKENHPRRKVPAPKNVKVTPEKMFSGFDNFEKVINAGVDLVILATPPGFRPQHFEAVVNAGKHCFCEKPVATDPVGIQRFLKAGKASVQKGLCVVAGTQRRHDPAYIETIDRIKKGEIGDVTACYAYWNMGALWLRPRQPGMTDMHFQTTNWYYFDWICGDHIVEQHVHNLDVCNWVMGAYPAKALGIGGRQVRTGEEYGNIYDHFTIDYEYPNGVHMLSMCRQQKGTDGNVSEFIVGAKGQSDPSGRIQGASRWRYRGEKVDPYLQEHVNLINAIRSGNKINESESVALSTLTAIMGRESAYTGKAITWDEIMKSNLDLLPKKMAWGPVKVRPVPQPGEPRSTMAI